MRDRKDQNPLGILLAVVLVAMILLVGLSGCSDKIDAKAIEPPLREMIARHDKYVKADTALGLVDKGIYLRTSSLITKALDTALAREKAKKVPDKGPSADASDVNHYLDTLPLGQNRAETLPDALEKAVYEYVADEHKRQTGRKLSMEDFKNSLKNEEIKVLLKVTVPQKGLKTGQKRLDSSEYDLNARAEVVEIY